MPLRYLTVRLSLSISPPLGVLSPALIFGYQSTCISALNVVTSRFVSFHPKTSVYGRYPTRARIRLLLYVPRLSGRVSGKSAQTVPICFCESTCRVGAGSFVPCDGYKDSGVS